MTLGAGEEGASGCDCARRALPGSLVMTFGMGFLLCSCVLLLLFWIRFFMFPLTLVQASPNDIASRDRDRDCLAPHLDLDHDAPRASSSSHFASVRSLADISHDHLAPPFSSTRPTNAKMRIPLRDPYWRLSPTPRAVGKATPRRGRGAVPLCRRSGVWAGLSRLDPLCVFPSSQLFGDQDLLAHGKPSKGHRSRDTSRMNEHTLSERARNRMRGPRPWRREAIAS